MASKEEAVWGNHTRHREGDDQSSRQLGLLLLVQTDFEFPQRTRRIGACISGLDTGWVCKNFVRSHYYIYRHGSLAHAERLSVAEFEHFISL